MARSENPGRAARQGSLSRLGGREKEHFLRRKSPDIYLIDQESRRVKIIIELAEVACRREGEEGTNHSPNKEKNPSAEGKGRCCARREGVREASSARRSLRRKEGGNHLREKKKSRVHVEEKEAESSQCGSLVEEGESRFVSLNREGKGREKSEEGKKRIYSLLPKKG